MQVQGKVQRDAVGQLQVEQGCGWHLLCDQLARAGEGGGNHNIEAALLQRVLDRHGDKDAIFHHQDVRGIRSGFQHAPPRP